MNDNAAQGVRPGWHVDLPGLVRRVLGGDVLHVADGEALVAGMDLAPLGVPPEVLLHPRLHRPDQRARHLPLV